MKIKTNAKILYDDFDKKNSQGGFFSLIGFYQSLYENKMQMQKLHQKILTKQNCFEGFP